MVETIEVLRNRKEQIQELLKCVATHDREKRHSLLDEYSEVDTKLMIEQTKSGEWECDACGTWDKMKRLIIHGKAYDLCSKCYEAEHDD